MSELLPCPFCGSVRAPEVSDVGECEECTNFDDCLRRQENHTCEGCDEWERPMFVVCNYNISGCGVSGPYRKTKAEAIAAWNSRAERTCFADEVTHRDCKYSVNRGWRERTCKFTIEDNMNETEGMGDVWIECSACNCVFDYYADEWLMKMSYCPNCGCKVIGG